MSASNRRVLSRVIVCAAVGALVGLWHLAVPAAAQTPSVAGIAPTMGAAGVVVTITGAGFTGATGVSFGGVPATSFAVDSDTQIRASVPAGALSGPISVTAPGGTFSSQTSFEVSPIQHVVVIDQENHSFDSVLGKFCADATAGTIVRPGLDMPCDGATTGETHDGTVIPLPKAPDVVPYAEHSQSSQEEAINGGLMNDFDLTKECSAQYQYQCYAQYWPGQIPNLAQYAARFTVSDRTFEFRNTASWAGHLVLATATLDGFQGVNPQPVPGVTPGPGWGCDSRLQTPWSSDGVNWVDTWSCIPDQAGKGPAGETLLAPWVPTIFDRLAATQADPSLSPGFTWKIYGGAGPVTATDPNPSGYVWSVCTYVWECIGNTGPGSQRSTFVPVTQLGTDIADGTLPSYSLVTPTEPVSQHNGVSMRKGDQYLAKIVTALYKSPYWSSTAIFITYDDCGCFYDHVPPPNFNASNPATSWGIRVPLVIVSPWAKVGYTDSTPTTYMGILAFIEHQFGLPPLMAGADGDGAAYDFSNSFSFTAPNGRRVHRIVQTIPPEERAWLAAHPPNPNDPT